MAQQHFVTAERFFISFDDDFYQFNAYSSGQRTEMEAPNWELVRKSSSEAIIQGFTGIGTTFRNVTGITTGTFLTLPRFILPNT